MSSMIENTYTAFLECQQAFRRNTSRHVSGISSFTSNDHFTDIMRLILPHHHERLWCNLPATWRLLFDVIVLHTCQKSWWLKCLMFSLCQVWCSCLTVWIQCSWEEDLSWIFKLICLCLQCHSEHQWQTEILTGCDSHWSCIKWHHPGCCCTIITFRIKLEETQRQRSSSKRFVDSREQRDKIQLPVSFSSRKEASSVVKGNRCKWRNMLSW